MALNNFRSLFICSMIAKSKEEKKRGTREGEGEEALFNKLAYK